MVVSLWPCLTSSPSSRPWLCAACLLCLAHAVFPLLPVTDHGTNLVLASAPGLPLSLVHALLLAHPTTRIMLVSPGGPQRHTLLLWLLVTLLGVASLMPAVTHWFFRRKSPSLLWSMGSVSAPFLSPPLHPSLDRSGYPVV